MLQIYSLNLVEAHLGTDNASERISESRKHSSNLAICCISWSKGKHFHHCLLKLRVPVCKTEVSSLKLINSISTIQLHNVLFSIILFTKSNITGLKGHKQILPWWLKVGSTKVSLIKPHVSTRVRWTAFTCKDKLLSSLVIIPLHSSFFYFKWIITYYLRPKIIVHISILVCPKITVYM